jgi:predicted NAD/FAD-binding protein
MTPAGHEALEFDEVVFACHSDQALRMLADPSEREREIVGAFPYQPNEVVLHTDETLLPQRRRAWACWNYHIRGTEDPDVAVTYNMNLLQGLDSSSVYCVTLNESERIDRDRMLHRVDYEHPVYTSRRDSAQARHGEVIRANRTSFCGAYWGYGFHEDGVNSARAVGHAFGETLQ